MDHHLAPPLIISFNHAFFNPLTPLFGRRLLPPFAFTPPAHKTPPQQQPCARLSEPRAAASSARVFAPWPRFPWRPRPPPLPPPSPPLPPAPSSPQHAPTASSSPDSSPPRWRRRRPERGGSGRPRPPRRRPSRWAESRSRVTVSLGGLGVSRCDAKAGSWENGGRGSLWVLRIDCTALSKR